MVKRFDNMADFLAETDAHNGTYRKRGASDFNGYYTWAQSMQAAVVGLPKAVEAAEALMDLIDDEGLSLERPSWALDVAGAFPLVAAAIAGDPLNMFTPDTNPDQFTPVKIYVSACCSGGVSVKDLEKRGVACLALALKLAAVRPVELYVTSDMEGSKENGGSAVPVIKIDLQPLDMQAATFALTSATFLRSLCFNWGNKHGFNGAWAYNSQPQDAEYDRKMREELEISEDDIYVRGASILDENIKNPIAWIKSELDKFRAEEF